MTSQSGPEPVERFTSLDHLNQLNTDELDEVAGNACIAVTAETRLIERFQTEHNDQFGVAASVRDHGDPDEGNRIANDAIRTLADHYAPLAEVLAERWRYLAATAHLLISRRQSGASGTSDLDELKSQLSELQTNLEALADMLVQFGRGAEELGQIAVPLQSNLVILVPAVNALQSTVADAKRECRGLLIAIAESFS